MFKIMKRIREGNFSELVGCKIEPISRDTQPYYDTTARYVIMTNG